MNNTSNGAIDGQGASAAIQQNSCCSGASCCGPQAPITQRRAMPKVGRNDPCVCGNGKKYKKCCGAGA